MTADPNQMLTTAEAAALLGLQPCTLSAWREDGSHPDLPFFKLGKAVRYRYADLVAFVETRRASSTLLARKLNPPALPTRPDQPASAQARRKPRRATRGSDGQQSLF